MLKIKRRIYNLIGPFSIFSCLTIFIICVSSLEADKLSEKERALNMIADFADRICKDIPIEGTDEQLILSGEAKAKLNKLVKQLANIGIEAAGKYDKKAYQGILQKDLVEVLKNSTECKMTVFEKLKNVLLQDYTIPPNTGGHIPKKLPAYKAIGSSMKSKRSGPQNVLNGKTSRSFSSSWWPRPGDTVGAWIEFYLNKSCIVNSINHYIMLPNEHRVKSQIRNATLRFSDGSTQQIAFSYKSGWQTVNLHPVKTDKVRLTVDDIFPSSRDSSQLQVIEFELIGHSCE